MADYTPEILASAVYDGWSLEPRSPHTGMTCSRPERPPAELASDRCGLGLVAAACPQEINRDSGRDQEQSGDRRKRPRFQHIHQEPAGDLHEQCRGYWVSPHLIGTCKAGLLIAQYDHARDHQTIREPDREHRVIEESFVGTADD